MEKRAFSNHLGQTLKSGVGSRISRRRTAQGLTLAELGAAAGMESRRLRLYEAGEEAIPLASLLRLAVALRTPIDQLLDGPT